MDIEEGFSVSKLNILFLWKSSVYLFFWYAETYFRVTIAFWNRLVKYYNFSYFRTRNVFMLWKHNFTWQLFLPNIFCTYYFFLHGNLPGTNRILLQTSSLNMTDDIENKPWRWVVLTTIIIFEVKPIIAKNRHFLFVHFISLLFLLN